jgi:ribonuclease BN (tRNA processing enzyme)
MFWQIIMVVFVMVFSISETYAESCSGRGIELQVLGSGGPEVQDKRASSGYVIWQDGKARILIDCGGGSALRFGQSNAQMKDLHVVLFTHFHVDHAADFPVLVKSSFFEDRTRPLPVFGPAGSGLFPSTTEFIKGHLDKKKGIYRYLSDYLTGGESSYAIKPNDVALNEDTINPVYSESGLKVYGLAVKHGIVPAIAWRVEIGGVAIVIAGDSDGENKNMVTLVKDADLLVATNAIPENAVGVERKLHMPPSVIGKIAADGKAKKLILSHRMLRTIGREDETIKFVSQSYKGPAVFANDLDCYSNPLNP